MNKKINKVIVMCCCMAAASLYFLMPEAIAGEEGGSLISRSTWDEAMLWLNFGILAFVVVKFGKTPFMNFLRGKKEEVSSEIGQLEDEKQRIIAQINKTFKILDESERQFADMKKRIVEQGEKRKTNIIEEARQQSKFMLEMAKTKIENQIVQAKEMFRSELIDESIRLATERLPGEITEEDTQKLEDDYLAGISAK